MDEKESRIFLDNVKMGDFLYARAETGYLVKKDTFYHGKVIQINPNNVVIRPHGNGVSRHVVNLCEVREYALKAPKYLFD